MFSSTLTSSSLPALHAMNAFNIDDMEMISVKSESWGVMVEVLTGDHAGVYDYHASNNSFIAA